MSDASQKREGEQSTMARIPFYKQPLFLPMAVIALLMIPLTLVLSKQEQNLFSLAANETYTAGVTTIGRSMDSGNQNGISATQVTTDAHTGVLNTIAVYIGSVQATPLNHMQVAIYADDGTNKPGNLITASASQVLTPRSWNTFPLSNVVINANTKYWLAFNVDGKKTQYAIGGSTQQTAAWDIPTTFGKWPSAFGTPTSIGKEQYSIYMTYTGVSSPLPTVLPTATPAPQPTDIPTATPITTITPAPTGSPISGGGVFCSNIPSTPGIKPTAANTGVPAGTVLSTTPPASVIVTADSWQATASGTIIDSKDTQGKRIDVQAPNVIIRNSRIRVPDGSEIAAIGKGVNDDPDSLQVINSEVYSNNGAFTGVIIGNNSVICGVNAHGFENNAIAEGNNMVIQGNYFHINAAVPGKSDPHNDGLEVRVGNGIKILNNNIVQTNLDESWQHNTSALYVGATWGDIDQVKIDNNWFGGGTYSLYNVTVKVGGMASNTKHCDGTTGSNAVLCTVDVTNNRWYRGSYEWGPYAIDDSTPTTSWKPHTWINNTFEDNGQAITP